MILPSVFESYQVNRRNGWEVSSEVYYTIYWSLWCSRKSALAVEVYRSNDSLSAGGGMSLLALLLRNRNIWEATILYSINFSWSIEIEITEVYVYRLSVQASLSLKRNFTVQSKTSLMRSTIGQTVSYPSRSFDFEIPPIKCGGPWGTELQELHKLRQLSCIMKHARCAILRICSKSNVYRLKFRGFMIQLKLNCVLLEQCIQQYL